MHYKTIALALIEENPTLHSQLRQSRTMLATLNAMAEELKLSHERWIEIIARKRPDSGSIQISSDALEIVVQDLRDRLLSESDPIEDAVSLDAAMAYLRRHTPIA